jgi:hypothetical protein
MHNSPVMLVQSHHGNHPLLFIFLGGINKKCIQKFGVGNLLESSYFPDREGGSAIKGNFKRSVF